MASSRKMVHELIDESAAVVFKSKYVASERNAGSDNFSRPHDARDAQKPAWNTRRIGAPWH